MKNNKIGRLIILLFILLFTQGCDYRIYICIFLGAYNTGMCGDCPLSADPDCTACSKTDNGICEPACSNVDPDCLTDEGIQECERNYGDHICDSGCPDDPDCSATTTTTIETTTTIDSMHMCLDPAYPYYCIDGCCPLEAPICCSPGGCCPADYPHCGSDGMCYKNPVGSTTTITIPSETTTTIESNTTTTPGNNSGDWVVCELVWINPANPNGCVRQSYCYEKGAYDSIAGRQIDDCYDVAETLETGGGKSIVCHDNLFASNSEKECDAASTAYDETHNCAYDARCCSCD